MREKSKSSMSWLLSPEILISLGSGVLLFLGLITSHKLLFWAALGLGATQFVPGAIKHLVVNRKLSINLLMTISAAGAVALGLVKEAAVLAFLYSIVEALETAAMDKARTGLTSLVNLLPSTAWRIDNNGQAHEIPASEIKVGDLLRVKQGKRVPTDGTLIDERADLDVSAITGELLPLAVEPGGEIRAGSIPIASPIRVRATALVEDNSLTAVVKLVRDAQEEKGRRARLANRIARFLMPSSLVVALAVLVLGAVFGDASVWLERALIVLVAASPCALMISVPLTVLSGVSGAGMFGVGIKSGAAYEAFGDVDVVAFDKTGTLTLNEPTVSDVVTVGSVTRDEVLRLAAALESFSTHPIAKAVIEEAPSDVPTAQGVIEMAGKGLNGYVDDRYVFVGNAALFLTGELAAAAIQLENEGCSVIAVKRDSEYIGVIAIRDNLRDEAPEVIAGLHQNGLATVMLTGDNERTAKALGDQAGITDIRARRSPEQKAEVIRELRSTHTVATVGDGINDSPALAASDVGIAMGMHGSDVARESADIAFAGEDLRLMYRALRHARRGRQIMVQNFIVSLLIIVVLAPLAIFGVLGLASVVLIHEGVEVLVVLNGLRAGCVKCF